MLREQEIPGHRQKLNESMKGDKQNEVCNER